jgi:hypothetical protein
MTNLRDVASSLIKEGVKVLQTPIPASRERAWIKWRADLDSAASAHDELALLPRPQRVDEIQKTLLNLRTLVGTEAPGPAESGRKTSVASKAPPRTKQPTDTAVARVFISYRQEEAHVAKTLRTILMKLYRTKVKIFLADEAIRAGLEYRKQIYDGIADSNWFVLLYTDPEGDWQWPITEAARFEAVQDVRRRNNQTDHSRRLCVLHATPDQPKPLRDFQSYQAELPPADRSADDQLAFYKEQSKIGVFFKELESFVKKIERDDIPTEREETLANAARELCEAFEAARSNRVLGRIGYAARAYLVLDHEAIGSPQAINHGRIVLDERARMIFGIERKFENQGANPRQRGGSALSWSEFVTLAGDRARGSARPLWVEQIEYAVEQVMHRRSPTPVTALIYSTQMREYFRPVLVSQEALVGGMRRIHLLFVEHMQIDFKSHSTLGILMSALILSSRFRFELIGERQRQLALAKSLAAVQSSSAAMQSQLLAIEREGAAHGLMDEETLLACFDGRGRDILERSYAGWGPMRPRLFELFQKISDATTFEEACTARSSIQSILLDHLKPMNAEFLEICVERYRDLMMSEVRRGD